MPEGFDLRQDYTLTVTSYIGDSGGNEFLTICRNYSENADGFDVDCSDPFVSPFCQATVGQVEACVTADTEIYLDYVRAPTCAAAGNIPELERLLAVPPPPMECEILRSVCPSLGDGFYGGR